MVGRCCRTAAPAAGDVKLQIFLDRSVAEVFANDTACIAKTVAALAGDLSLNIRAEGGGAVVEAFKAWPLKGIWQRKPPGNGGSSRTIQRVVTPELYCAKKMPC